ncbi:MAG: MmgE/PrpD family protein [Betaproteobacteria bacterium]|nr:MmgE/PrpD family protein [Betaproteobacteria bacterium]
MNESRELAKFVSELKYEKLPRHVIARAKDLVLDQVGIMMACSTLPWSKIINNYVRDWGDCKQESTIAHYGYKTKVENAVFANSSFGHGFEIDDHYPPGESHPGCIVVPSALAMAERQGANGEDLIVAVVAGYEVMGRINRAITPSCSNRGFHAHTSISGPFGAAAAAGKILSFAPDLMLNALSIAGSHSSGTKEYDQGGGSVKRMHAGMAAHAGIRSALIAQKGITGPGTILEGKHGFFHAFADEYKVDEVTDGLGSDFKIVMGQGFKFYCSCGAMHSALDGLRILMAQHKDINENNVAEIVMGTNSNSRYHVDARLTDITSAQFSAPFSLAMTVITGKNGFSDYTEQNLRNPRILNLAAKVKMVIDPEMEKEAAKRGSRVTVRLKNGKVYEQKVEYCKGLPENPLTREEFEDKFRGLAGVVAEKETTDKILHMVRQLDEIPDVRSLVSLMCTCEDETEQ